MSCGRREWVGLSGASVFVTGVPFVLSTDDERAIGHSVLDEALSTINSDIPIYSSASGQRPYAGLFSPLTGLDFAAIRRGNMPVGARP